MSKSFIRFGWITLVLIYLVVIAGGIVRTSGSGMGCPDWPKCFNQVIPPTDISELPADYKDIYVNKRKLKVDKFSKVLTLIGMGDIAIKLKNDKTLLVEQDFNWKKTWIEYVNRLVGFLAGNFVLILFVWSFIKYRSHRKLVLLCFVNLVFMGFEGWLGSIVVATNLVPWVLTIHMLFALVIIWIQIKIIRIAENQKFQLKINRSFKILFYASILLTMVQILLGSQVRQKIDFMIVDNIDRGEWIGQMNIDFYFHRSLIWLVIIVNGFLFWLNRKYHFGMTTFKYVLVLIGMEFLTGLLFSYAGMPAVLQPVHLVVASAMFAVQLYGLKYLTYKSESLIR